MSLDVYLEDAVTHCKHCGAELKEPDYEDVFEANITHNLTDMAREVGAYYPVWRPDEVGIERASQLIEPLTYSIGIMRENPDKAKAHNPANGWGDYDGFLGFLLDYRTACVKHPDAKVRAHG